jgi:hypothetical protein
MQRAERLFVLERSLSNDGGPSSFLVADRHEGGGRLSRLVGATQVGLDQRRYVDHAGPDLRSELSATNVA